MTNQKAGSSELFFSDAVVTTQLPSVQVSTSTGATVAISFMEFSAVGQGAGAIGSTSATVRAKISGIRPGRIRFLVRARVELSTGGKGVLCIWDGSSLRKKRYSNRETDVLVEWTRKARPGDVIQLCLFATTRVTSITDANAAASIFFESVDIESVTSKS